MGDYLDYTISYYKGTPSECLCILRESIKAKNDLQAHHIRLKRVIDAPQHDFNTICQTKYLEQLPYWEKQKE